MHNKQNILLLLLCLFILSGCAISKNIDLYGNVSNGIHQEKTWYIPTLDTTWQWQLSGNLNTNHDVDLYNIDLVNTSAEQIKLLHDKDIKVICYFSAGSYEDFRPDANKFQKNIIGKQLEGWPDEKWLDISRYEQFSDIIINRLDLAVTKNCDGIEPDNINAYEENSGFHITFNDQLKYNKWLANQAHSRNLSIALKNDINQVNELVDDFDFIINEQCFQYNECDKLLPFIRANKAVLGVEYEIDTDQFCHEANKLKFSWLKMEYDLNGNRISCK
jgi:hypothetical protein